MKNILLVSVFALFLTGCVHYMPAAVSSTSIGSKYEVPVRTVTGTSTAYYISVFGPFGDDSINAAIKDAKSQAPSDSIANVFVDRKLICFPLCSISLYTRIQTTVYGTLVKYTKEDGTPMATQDNSTDVLSGWPSLSKTVVAVNNSQGAAKPAAKACYEYYCLCDLKEEELKPVVDGLNQKDKAKLASEARKKVRACYPEKPTDNIVVPPEIQMLPGEIRLLEHMCRTGMLNR